MAYGKRDTDRDPIHKLWDLATPYIQISGFVILCAFISGVVYTTFQSYGTALAANQITLNEHEKRINALENGNAQINQKLDDMIIFFRVPHSAN